MTHSNTPRWRRSLVIAASVLLSAGAAVAAGATDAATQPEQAPVTALAPADPAPTEPVATEPVATEPVATDTVESEPVATEVPPTEVTPTEAPASEPATADPATTEPQAATTTLPVEVSGQEVTPAPPATPMPEGTTADEGHDGPTITINGQPFKGEADPKLDGCSIVLAVSGLSDGSHTITGAIAAGEEGSTVLVAIDATFDGTFWTDAWALDDLVGDLEQKPNGYKLRIVLTIDGGATLESRPFWLACGAAQEGNPFVIVLDKQWQSADGTVLAGPPAGLPDDWVLTATSKLGTATCSYPDAGDELVCVYDNKGAHEGATEGLYVPGGKKHTYTVSESPPPEGWSLISGTGTFSPRAVCPGGGDDGGHEDAREEPGGRPPCPHLVVNRRNVVPPTTSTTTTSTTTTSTTAPVSPTTVPGSDVKGAETDVVPPGGSTLPRTGSDPRPFVAVGAALILGGFALLRGRRRALHRS